MADKNKNMKQISKFYCFLVKREFFSVKFWAVFLFMFAMCGTFYHPLTRYLLQTDDRIGVWEMAGSLFYSTRFAGLVYFVGAIVLTGSIPHTSEDTVYYLFRGSRKNWLGANVLFLATESLVYYAILVVFTGVYCLPGISLNNEWSALYRSDLLPVEKVTGFFSQSWVVVCMDAIFKTTPVRFFGRSFLFAVLSTIFIGATGMVFAIYGKRRWGLFAEVFLVIACRLIDVHLVGMRPFVIISWLDPVSFISAKWNDPTAGYSNMLYQIFYLCLTIGGMYLLSLRHIRKTDWT